MSAIVPIFMCGKKNQIAQKAISCHITKVCPIIDGNIRLVQQISMNLCFICLHNDYYSVSHCCVDYVCVVSL